MLYISLFLKNTMIELFFYKYSLADYNYPLVNIYLSNLVEHCFPFFCIYLDSPTCFLLLV